MPAHVLHGDSFLVAKAQAKLEAQDEASGLLDANRHRLEGTEATLNELVEICNALPFMDTVRLVVVQGLLATLEGRRAPRRARRGSNQGQEPSGPSGGALGSWEGLPQAVTGMPPTTLLIFSDGTVSQSNPLLKALANVSQVRGLPAPGGQDLARWIKDAAQEKGSVISPAAISTIINLVGNDLWALDRELEKLSLYAWGRTIEDTDVPVLVSQATEANIFTAVDAMIEGRQRDAISLLQHLRDDGRDPLYIIAMIQRQVRLLALAKSGMDQRASQKELGEQMGTSSQFVIRKTMQQARRHTWEDITWRYQRLLEADLSIKRGKMEPGMALDLLVADQSSLRRN
ncbi:MAG: DNA polymerase III subunit delta [SAR202 cluster bacterium Io17-Chloro-G2]|nr:MAG: DNA polymerase III subunit delta [SAR202 cluster bacterium Io17-Chloro-G2]